MVRVLGGISRADIYVSSLCFIITDIAGTVLQKGTLYTLDIRSGNPDRVLDVTDVGIIGVVAAEPATCDRACAAICKSGDGFTCRAGPALQGVSRHFAVAAAVKPVLCAAVSEDGTVAGQHILRIVGIGIVEEAML